MIYLLSSYSGNDRPNLAIEMHRMFQEAGVESKVVVLSFLLQPDYKYSIQEIQHEDTLNAYNTIQKREDFPSRIFGLDALKISPDYRVLRNPRHVFFYLDEQDLVRYKVRFYDIGHLNIKSVEKYNEDGTLFKTYEYDDRGFLSSIFEKISDKQEKRTLIDAAGKEIIHINYRNFTIQEVDLPDGKILSERAFKGEFLKKLIEKSDKDDRFLITADYEIAAPLMETSVVSDKLFLMIDQGLDGGKLFGLGEEVFTNNRVNTVILNTKKELDIFKQRFASRSTVKFVWNNYLPTLDKQSKALREKKSKVYIDAGAKGSNINWEELFDSLKKLSQELPAIEFVIETTSTKAAVELRKIIDERQMSEFARVIGSPYRLVGDKEMSEARLLLSLHPFAHYSYRIREALSYEIPIICLPDALEEGLYVTDSNGMVVSERNVAQAILALLTSLDFQSKHISDMETIKKEFNVENTVARYKEILQW